MTYTYAVLDVSEAAYNEIAAKLRAAGYSHVFDKRRGEKDLIDMHGIALAIEDTPTPTPEPAFDAAGRSEHCSACQSQLVADATGLYCPECTPR